MRESLKRKMLQKAADIILSSAKAGVRETCPWTYYQPKISEELKKKIQSM